MFSISAVMDKLGESLQMRPNLVGGNLSTQHPFYTNSPHGQVADVIDIRRENDSGRFPLELGQRYLLFLSRDARDYFVDNCGASRALSDRRKLLRALEQGLGTGALSK
jgi:hypothetical protein